VVFVPQRKSSHETPGPVKMIALIFNMYMFFGPHRKYTYKTPQPLTGINFFLKCRRYSYLTGNNSAGLHDLLNTIALFFVCNWSSYLTGNTLTGLHGPLRFGFTFINLGDIHASQETHLWASTTWQEDSLIFLFTPCWLKCLDASRRRRNTWYNFQNSEFFKSCVLQYNSRNYKQ
jgi:hypothetical protein